jgi:hypothetical protein
MIVLCTTCFKHVNWTGAVLGSEVTINEGFVTCGTCDGFIDNEMWLIDTTSSLCTSAQDGLCWVEAGYQTYTTNNATNGGGQPSCITNSAANCYFWADNRPGNGSFHEHVVANVPSSDYGNNTSFYIQQGSSPSNWNVQIATASGNYYQGTSTFNGMSPSDIEIGQELYGTDGAGANQTDFFYSEWADTQGHGFHYQTSPGTITTDQPPYGYWVDSPNDINNGGDFCTAC